MEHNSPGLWQERLKNQQHALIGSAVPGDGNGYFDRISPELPYHRLQDLADPFRGYWLYIVYFRDLAYHLNPSYGRDKEQLKTNFYLTQASENFKNTFMRYLNKYEPLYRIDLLSILGDWAQRLINDGRVVFEFVSWFDNESGVFYGYELELLDNRFYQDMGDHFIYDVPQELEDDRLENQQFNIPKSKCIIIDWPEAYGGYQNFLDTVKTVQDLGDINDSFAALLDEPGKLISSKKNWEIDFEKALIQWGTTKPNEQTTDYYQEWSWFNYKRTVVHCMHSLVGGMQQIVNILNEKLGENVVFNCDAPKYDLHILNENYEKWTHGGLSFKEANAYLTAM